MLYCFQVSHSRILDFFSGNVNELNGVISEAGSDSSSSTDKKESKQESRLTSSRGDLAGNDAKKTDDNAIAVGKKSTKEVVFSYEKGRKRTFSRERPRHSKEYELAKRRREEIEQTLRNDGLNNGGKTESAKVIEDKLSLKKTKGDVSQDVKKDDRKKDSVSTKKFSEEVGVTKKTENSGKLHLSSERKIELERRKETESSPKKRNEIDRHDVRRHSLDKRRRENDEKRVERRSGSRDRRVNRSISRSRDDKRRSRSRSRRMESEREVRDRERRLDRRSRSPGRRLPRSRSK